MRFALSGLLLLLLATCAFGAAIDDAVKPYIREGENYGVVSVNASGVTYFLVKVGGQDSMVFDSTYNLVTDNATIGTVMAYREAPSNQTITLAGIEQALNDTKKFNETYDTFYDAVYKWGHSPAYTQMFRSQAGYKARMDAERCFNYTYAVPPALNNSIALLEQAQAIASGGPIESADLQLLMPIFNLTVDYMAQAKNNYTRARNTTIWPNLFKQPNVNTTPLDNARTRINNYIAAIPTAGNTTTLVEQVRLQTAYRLRVKDSKAAVDAARDRFTTLGDLILNVTSTISSAYLETQFLALQDLLNAMEASYNAGDVNKTLLSKTDFDVSATSLESDANRFSNLASEKDASDGKMREAQAEIRKAEIRLGEDPQLDAIHQKYGLLTASRDDLLSKLNAGASVNASDFQSLGVNATALKDEAAALKRSEQILDLPIIIAAIAGVALFGGVWFILRKRGGGAPAPKSESWPAQPQQPVPPEWQGPGL